MTAPSLPSPRHQARVLWRCEIRQLLRDRRALFAGVLLPALLYPLLFWSQGKVESVAEGIMAERELTVAMNLDDLDAQLEADLRAGLLESGEVTLVDLESAADTSSLWEKEEAQSTDSDSPAPALRSTRLDLLGEADALLVGRSSPDQPDAYQFRVFFDVQRDDSREASSRARKVVGALATKWRNARLESLPGGDPAAHLSVESTDIASPEDKSGAGLGRLLPIFSLLMLLSGGAFAALGAFAGEREGKTLETLLVQPVPSWVVAMGKYGAVLCAGMATLAINLVSLGLCTSQGLVDLPGLSDGSLTLPPARLLAALLYLPACALIAALLCLFCGKARSYREGQFTLIPVMLMAVLPSLLVLRPDLEATPLLSVVPFAGPALLLRDGLAGQFFLLPTLLMLASHGLWTWLVLRRLTGVLDAERILSSKDVSAEAGQRSLSAGHGKAWAFVGVLVLYLVGSRLQQWSFTWGLGLSLWGLLGILTLLLLRTRPAPTRDVSRTQFLSLRWPEGTQLLGATLLIPALVVLMVKVYLPFQSQVLPLPQSATVDAGLLATLEALHPALLVFLMAISPAICEELFFRGAVLGSLRRGLSPMRALLWQALFFGAAHASLYRIVPTASLGLLLGALTLRTRSLLPAILVHAGYNTVVVLNSMDRIALEGVAFWSYGPWLALPGVLLLARRTPQASQAEDN